MVIRLEFTSAFEMLEMVQSISDQVVKPLGLDEDDQIRVSIAIRESVVNAITHGNRNDANKRVFMEFATENAGDACELTIRVRDQGEGFDPACVPDPLAPENLLKTSGRGIHLIRSFMDHVELDSTPDRGTEVLMIKRVPLDIGAGNPQV